MDPSSGSIDECFGYVYLNCARAISRSPHSCSHARFAPMPLLQTHPAPAAGCVLWPLALATPVLSAGRQPMRSRRCARKQRLLQSLPQSNQSQPRSSALRPCLEVAAGTGCHRSQLPAGPVACNPRLRPSIFPPWESPWRSWATSAGAILPTTVPSLLPSLTRGLGSRRPPPWVYTLGPFVDERPVFSAVPVDRR